MQCDVAIVGGGVAGQLTAWFLRQREPGLKIALIADNRRYPPCSVSSTGIVSLFNVSRGVSFLGDELWKGYHLAARFFAERDPRGVESAEDESGGSLWLVRPRLFLDWMAQESGHDSYQYSVQGVSSGRVETLEGPTFSAGAIVLACGAYIKGQWERFPPIPQLEESRVVAGSFASFAGVDLGESSFLLSKERDNLIYRASDRTVLLGSTTNPGADTTPDQEGVKKIYDKFSEVSLPSWDGACFHVGLRHKGKKRRPFWGEIAPGVYAITGLYRGGWSLSFAAAEKLTEMLLSSFSERSISP